MTKYKIIIRITAFILLLALLTACGDNSVTVNTDQKGDFIKYVEFNPPYEWLDHALSIDIKSHEEDEYKVSWIDLLSYAAAKTGGTFKNEKVSLLDEAKDKINSDESLENLKSELKYFSYYREAYGAVLEGMVGNYEQETTSEDGEKHWEQHYGLMAFSPIAKGYPYSECDDFGAKRSFGYSRPHLGHDMMGQIGTPIIAVEGGTVENLGWNMYGGWRIGIRSEDKKRYYYYAHLRQNYPYQSGLEIGSKVTAGSVIGYLGHTGYSTVENTNNIQTPHLHFGLELIFDESQKECDNEIWVDVYPLVRLLRSHQMQTQKVPDSKEHKEVDGFRIIN